MDNDLIADFLASSDLNEEITASYDMGQYQLTE